MSQTRKMSRAAARAAAKLAEAPKPMRFRVVGLVVQVEVEVLNDAGKAKARRVLVQTLPSGQSQVVQVHLVEEQLDRLNRQALIEILAENGIEPTD